MPKRQGSSRTSDGDQSSKSSLAGSLRSSLHLTLVTDEKSRCTATVDSGLSTLVPKRMNLRLVSCGTVTIERTRIDSPNE